MYSTCYSINMGHAPWFDKTVCMLTPTNHIRMPSMLYIWRTNQDFAALQIEGEISIESEDCTSEIFDQCFYTTH